MALDNIHSQLQEMRDRMQLKEKWNEKLAIKALGEYRKVYEMMKKTGVDKRWIASMEKFYDDLVIGGMLANEVARGDLTNPLFYYKILFS